MANFKVHIGVATAVSVVAGLTVYSMGLADRLDAALLMIIGVVGGILPDIDSENSTSIKIVFSILAFFVSFFAIFLMLPLLGVLVSLAVSAILFFCIRFALMTLCRKCTKHRGAIHSPAFGILCALTLAYGVSFFNKDIAPLAGLFLMIGFLVHLSLDEFYSVDLQGIRMKKSFGTALTLFSFNNPLGYFLVYGLLAVFIYLNIGQSTNFMLTIKSINWSLVKDNLFIPDWKKVQHTVTKRNGELQMKVSELR
jgi:hypothetical protein